MFFSYAFVTNYYADQQKINLTESAKQVASVVQAGCTFDYVNDTLVIYDPGLFHATISAISKSIDADIFIVNNKGKCEYCSEGTDNCQHLQKNVPSYILAQTTKNEFFEQGNLNNYYKEQYYTAGVPIHENDFGEEKLPAYCYVSTKTTFVNGLVMSFMKIFFAAISAVLLLSIILALIMSYTMVKPLRQMSIAAKQFATGDFSIRVPTKRKDEIGQLARAFNDMADSLSASESMRRSFIANLSHELKTPMTTIAGFIDGMIDGTIPKEEHEKYMLIVSNEVKRLSRLVTSMLSLSRIDNGELKVNKQDFDVFSMLLTILETYEQKINERKINIEGLEDFESITINADPDLIYQVIYNLIENAVKFTNENGYIKFSNVKTRYDISISIENSGPGIPPEDIRYIFDRFYKTDKSRSIDKKGMGLGLFITKTIMRLHNGDIFVESEVNNFTRFTIRLPSLQSQNKDKSNKNIESRKKSKTGELNGRT